MKNYPTCGERLIKAVQKNKKGAQRHHKERNRRHEEEAGKPKLGAKA